MPVNMKVPQNFGYIFGGPYNKDYSIWGSIMGPPILGNYHILFPMSSLGPSPLSSKHHLEGHGDLVSRLRMGISRDTIWVIGVINVLTKPPDPPSNGSRTLSMVNTYGGVTTDGSHFSPPSSSKSRTKTLTRWTSTVGHKSQSFPQTLEQYPEH